jgi:hypothetical protein
VEGVPEPIHETVFRGGHDCLEATVAEKFYQRPRAMLVEIRIEIVHQKEWSLAPFVSQEAELSGTQGYHRGA